MRKIELAKSIIRKYSHIFMCPLCGAMMRNESNSLVCSNRHCFNISKYGYIHLLAKPVKQAKYDKMLFESRQAIIRSGFFHPMIEEIREMISKEFASTNAKRIHVLDVGCGEGSHLANLVKELDAIGFEALGVGIDISKEGIQIASRDYLGFIWCVADLAQNPFRDQQFDVILNLFSPANYTGFARMLHDDGVLIKVVPGRDYLRELRELFYEETERQAYSNERVIKHFSQHFQPVGTRQIRYGKELSAHDLEHLIHMTPLTWGTTEGHIQNAFRSGFLM